MKMRRVIGSAALATILLAQPLAAQTFSATEFRALGAQQLEAGNLLEAATIVDALLARDANDAAALILGAKIATAANDLTNAARLARRAYWRTETPNDSFVAARIAANAHASLEQDSLAQLWLRLARQYSPNDDTSDGIARDYAFLRDRNPWSTSLSFGASPTSNVNGGGYGETIIYIFGEPVGFQAERPLPGIEITGNITTTYRIDASETHAQFLDLFANARTYHLLPKANEINPAATGQDYTSGSVGVGFRHRQVFTQGALPTDFSIRAAQNWSSGVVDTRTLDLAASHRWAMSDKSTLGFNLSNQHLIEKDGDPATNYGLTATWTQMIGKDRLQFSVAGKTSTSDSYVRDYVSRRVFGSYDFGQDLNGLHLGLDFDYDARDYDGGPAGVTGNRSDTTTSLTVRVRNENLEFYGFQPVVSLNGTRVDSNIGQFDRDFVSLGFDLQSSF